MKERPLTFKEALVLSERDLLIKEYCLLDNPLNPAKDNPFLRDYVERLISVIPMSGQEKNILSIYPSVSYDETFNGKHFRMEVSLYYRYPLSRCANYRCKHTYSLDELEAIPGENLEKLKNELWEEIPEEPQSYAIGFVPVEQLLGFSLSFSQIRKFGLEKMVAAILYESTFYGYDGIDTQKEMIIEMLEHTAEEAEDELTSFSLKDAGVPVESGLSEEERKEREYELDTGAIEIIWNMQQKALSRQMIMDEVKEAVRKKRRRLQVKINK